MLPFGNVAGWTSETYLFMPMFACLLMKTGEDVSISGFGMIQSWLLIR
jgi:hypothetical protein